MSRLELPLLCKTLLSGDILLRAELQLRIMTSSLAWVTLDFRVDSGTEMTTIPAARAKRLDIPYAENPIPNLRLAGTNGEVRAGQIRAQIVGMDVPEFLFPCYFVGDPDPPYDPNSARLHKNLLGLTGVIDKVRIIFESTSSALAPHGVVVVEKL